ncbi:hypothetical protein CRENBAI_018072, partial [Crenichthys baileyi]
MAVPLNQQPKVALLRTCLEVFQIKLSLHGSLLLLRGLWQPDREGKHPQSSSSSTGPNKEQEKVWEEQPEPRIHQGLCC